MLRRLLGFDDAAADPLGQLESIPSREAFEALLPLPLAVVFKHSNFCPTSAFAQREVLKFRERHPDVPVHRVLVVEDRDVSRHIAVLTGVPHESPQILILREGRVVWHDSHSGVNAEAISDQLQP